MIIPVISCHFPIPTRKQWPSVEPAMGMVLKYDRTDSLSLSVTQGANHSKEDYCKLLSCVPRGNSGPVSLCGQDKQKLKVKTLNR